MSYFLKNVYSGSSFTAGYNTEIHITNHKIVIGLVSQGVDLDVFFFKSGSRGETLKIRKIPQTCVLDKYAIQTSTQLSPRSKYIFLPPNMKTVVFNLHSQ